MAKTNTKDLLPQAAWDFDSSTCPAQELEHCCFYEYALEIPAVIRLVTVYRREHKKLLNPGDDIGDVITTRLFGFPFWVLARYEDFPKKHWLQIDPAVRSEKIKDLPPYPRMSSPPGRSNYEGPRAADVTRVKAEWIRWRTIEEDFSRLRSEFENAYKANSFLDFPTKVKIYLTQHHIEPNGIDLRPASGNAELVLGGMTIPQWTIQLSKLNGSDLYAEARKLLIACKKEIERYHRLNPELVVYEIDWHKRTDQLVKDFRRWVEINRPHAPFERGGGHLTKAAERLKALGAKRLLDFFRRNQPNKTIQHAMAFTSRRPNGTPRPPLYKTPKGWKDAEKSANDYLKELFS